MSPPFSAASSNDSISKEKRQVEEDYPKSWALAFLLVGLCLAVFVMSADRTIVTTALPYISDEFHSFPSSGWYASAYLLTSSALQPTFGRIFHMFNLKWTFLVAMAIFMVGSAVCASAANSNIFIVGRAITGVGSAGILSGSFVTIAHAVPLPKRPVYTAGIGMFYSFGSIAGPLLGGIFTSEVTWRWCFWLNLPIGAVTICTMAVLFNPRKRHDTSRLSLRQKLAQLDIGGGVLLLGGLTMLFLAFQFVNEGTPWGDGTIIGLLVGSFATIAVFVGWLWRRGEEALIPLSILRGRTMKFACANAFFLYSTLLLHVYYLSIWLQSVMARSAILSGVDLLAYIVPTALATIIAGIVTTKTGYFAPPAWIGCAIATVGAGLLITLHTHESTGDWIGYMIVAGAGIGLAIQQDFTAAQAVLPFEKVAIGTATITFSQTIGGALAVYVGNIIMIEELRGDSLPGVNMAKLIAAGATAFEHMLSPAALADVRVAYSSALRDVFITATVASGLAFLTSLGLEMRSVKDGTKSAGASDEERKTGTREGNSQ
ncbi:major facilitator superfamily domain-containing protein [Neohortaea acidophila]|uniref:Major facilitator superfamily domain-containing protein n=1 Tax=Neohortaea acidophila TaxID=245834 RepID=A0A6A6PQV6_9PEZI|nr:major facilitator superfamily domain-containing protein [Neohortaea acidophila]KAF2482480.1 major facilitator superfamily domain-containing protein [Neohortaea acidophila]